MAAAVVDGSGAVMAEARVPTPTSPDPETVFAALTAVTERVRRSRGAGARGLRRGLRRTDVGRGRGGEPAQHPGVGPVPVARSSAAPARPPGGGGQRRQGPGPRRGMAGCRTRLGKLPGHGGVHRGRGRYRHRPPAARGRERQCGPYRPRRGRAGGPVVRVRRPRLPRGRGVRAVHRVDDGAPGVGGTRLGATSHRDAGRTGGGFGGQSPRSGVGRGGRVGGPRVRRGVLRVRPGRDRPPGRDSTTRGPRGSSRAALEPMGRWSGRPRSGVAPCGPASVPRTRADGRVVRGSAARTVRTVRSGSRLRGGSGVSPPRSLVDGPRRRSAGSPLQVGGPAGRTCPCPTHVSGSSAWSRPMGSRTPCLLAAT